MTRKLVKVGSSLAVTLPSDIVKEFKLKKGQELEVSVHPTTGAITIRPGVRFFEEGKVTRRFRARSEEIRRRFDAAFRELAK